MADIQTQTLQSALATIRERTRDKVFVVANGAGSGLQDMLWSPPGASSFLVGAAFPYSTEQADEFLGYKPEHYCDLYVAIDYAMEAYIRAREGAITDGTTRAIGLGITASVASVKEHRGDHRIYACAIFNDGAVIAHLILPKGVGEADRVRDGRICDLFGLNVLLEAMGLPKVPIQVESRDGFSGKLHWVDGPWAFVPEVSEVIPSVLRERFFARPVFTRARRRAKLTDLDLADIAFLPASLNPPHQGHARMADVVERSRPGRRVVYSVTADSVHKPSLTVQQMLDRVAQVRRQNWENDFAGRTVVFTEGDPLFIDKARRWPGTEFVVGADTVLRMLDPKWGPDPERLLHDLQGLGVKLLVFGRQVEDEFVVAGDVLRNLSFDASPFRHMFVAMPGRWDVSSTALRAAG